MGNPYDYLNGASRAEESNDPRRVYRILTQILRFRPNFKHAGLHFQRARALYDLKRYHLALKDVEAAVSINEANQLKTERRAVPWASLIDLRMRIYTALMYVENDGGRPAGRFKALRDADDELLGSLYRRVEDCPGVVLPDCCPPCGDFRP